MVFRAGFHFDEEQIYPWMALHSFMDKPHCGSLERMSCALLSTYLETHSYICRADHQHYVVRPWSDGRG